jgi:UDP-glucose:(heptosyl)LPS alpha-1,3-glucosyltransferase
VRIAVISPFVDRQHGTERAVAEFIERLATRYQDEIDLYAQRVTGVTNVVSSHQSAASGPGIRWHPVPESSGPHLLQFLSWLRSNGRVRERNARASGKRPDVVFSPGINSSDADVILVHAVFHRLAELQSGRVETGLRALHRRLYYRLLCHLERRIYRDPRVSLAAVSTHTAKQLERYFGRNDVVVVPNGVDAKHFSSEAIRPQREESRGRLRLGSKEVALLLVGNDWRNKGLNALLSALESCKDLPVRLVVVGQDEQTPFRAEADRLRVAERVDFCGPDEDVRRYYAAADVLVAPSLEDSFNLPVLEAMACGLPVIVSPRAGISEWLTDGQDAVLLKDPENSGELAAAIRALATTVELRESIAGNAVRTAGKLSWDEHTAKLRAVLEKAARGSARP